MPYRRFSRRRGNRGPIVNSITNRRNEAFGVTSTATGRTLAQAVNTPDNTATTEVSQGCIIQAIWIDMSGCGLGGTGVLNNMGVYLMKNPGNNLTAPQVFTLGSSNEKRFVIKEWNYMIMRNQDGNNPFHWSGWIPIPKKYQRMATDDVWQLVFGCTSALTAHGSYNCIYKWKR